MKGGFGSRSLPLIVWTVLLMPQHVYLQNTSVNLSGMCSDIDKKDDTINTINSLFKNVSFIITPQCSKQTQVCHACACNVCTKLNKNDIQQICKGQCLNKEGNDCHLCYTNFTSSDVNVVPLYDFYSSKNICNAIRNNTLENITVECSGNTDIGQIKRLTNNSSFIIKPKNSKQQNLKCSCLNNGCMASVKNDHINKICEGQSPPYTVNDIGLYCTLEGLCEINDQCKVVILIDGGFTGQIRIPDLWYEDSLVSYSTCIFSFDVNTTTDQTYTGNKTCLFSDLNVWLNKSTTNFTIYITSNYQAKERICFLNGLHNSNWTRANLTKCSLIRQTCEDLFCLDFQNNCVDGQRNDTQIVLDNKVQSYQLCNSSFLKPEKNISLNGTLTESSLNKISDWVKNRTDEILSLMGNASSAALSLGDMSGIIVQRKKTSTESVSFVYSSETKFNIMGNEADASKFPVSVSISKEAFDQESNSTSGKIFAAVLRFPRFNTDALNSTLWNNDVYSIDMGATITDLQDPIILTFRNLNGNAECHSWNGGGSQPNWTMNGCNSTQNGEDLTCSCTHLTFFAVLMTDAKPSLSDVTNLTYITSIGCGLSVFFLGVALFMHFLLRRGHASDSVHVLINLFLALFLLNLTFLTNESIANTNNEIGCKLMGGLMHYAMLSSFQWFFIVALHLCLQLSQNVDEIKNYVTKIRIIGWVPPVIVVTGIFAAQKYNKVVIFNDATKNVSMCWITDITVHYVVNIGFYAIIFLFTLLTFVIIMRWICLLKTKQPKKKTIAEKKSKSSDAVTIMGLCCMLGLGWGFAFFAYGPLLIPSLYIFTILNSFQGFFLFIYYYNTSKLFGENKTLSEKSSTTTIVLENPYVADTGQDKTDLKKAN